MTTYRKMMHADIAAGLSLCRSAHWNQLAEDWEIFLNNNSEGSLVAITDNNVTGTVTTLNYGGWFSWVGMVLVDPDYRRKGIGIGLLNEALGLLQNEETIKLDATPEGREVYRQLQFRDEYPLTRMHAVVEKTGDSISAVTQVTKNDLPVLSAFDQVIFGADRRFLLERFFTGAPGLAFMEKDDDIMHGFCLGRNGFNFTHIGPVIAENTGTAKNLVSAALKNCIGKPVILDVPDAREDWLDWLSSMGFSKQRSFMRMYRGANAVHALPEKQYAIAGPEFG
jgi:GNAT superfamily N-acetyltransferase